MGGRDGLELLLPALVCFAVVAVESAFGLDFGGAVLGAGGATLGHRGGAVTGVRAGLRLRGDRPGRLAQCREQLRRSWCGGMGVSRRRSPDDGAVRQ